MNKTCNSLASTHHQSVVSRLYLNLSKNAALYFFKGLSGSSVVFFYIDTYFQKVKS